MDRRSLIALGISVPAFGRSYRLDLPDPRIHPLNTGGVRVVGISPDTTMLVGTRDNETLCILDASTRETISESDIVPNLGLLDIPTISWGPDGSQLAMSTRPWEVMHNSSILMMDVASGDVTDLTPEEGEDSSESLLVADEANVDTNPVWLDNDRILFSRHGVADKDLVITLCTISPAGGTVETWIDLSSHNVSYVTSRIWKRQDGTVVFGTDSRRDDRNINTALIVSPDGTVEEISLGEGGGMRLIDISDTHLIALDARMFSYVYIPLDAPDERGDIWEHFTLPATYRFQSDPMFGPEPNTVLLIAEDDNDQTFVLGINESETTEIAQLYESGGAMTVNWAEDVILVTSDDPAWLIEAE